MQRKASIAGAVVAGFPSPAKQYLGTPLDLNKLLVKRPAATYFIRIKGDSMVNAGIRAEDLLVLDRSLIPGARYRKSDVVFFGLERAGAPRQGDLFAAAEPTRPSKLYKAVDALNARYGRGMVFSAAEGIAKPWKMKRGKLSPRATTNWNELLVVG